MKEGAKVKVGVIGATGFTGEKLIEILAKHPKVTLSYLSAIVEKNVRFSEIFPRFKGRVDLVCKNLDVKEAAVSSDVIFLAVPHRVSLKLVPLFLKKGKTVIDLSADYRLKNPSMYASFYGIPHSDKGNLKTAVYGLPEFYKAKIKKTLLVANPGCYPTVSALSVAPLVKETVITDVIIDAKSGITGAGRKASLDYHYAHLNGNLFSYKPFGHQHLPEINQTISDIAGKKIAVRFTPHVIPAERGILITVYARLTKKVTAAQIESIYQKYYGDVPFVRVRKKGLPQLKDVVETNFCDIGFEVSGEQIVIVGVIDNLMKGASGQAVQNMNIVLGFDEEMGL